MRAAIIGYGVIGPVHAKVIPQYGELAAICDTDPTKLAVIPDVLHYTDYRKMLDEVHPDVVHICTPHYLHTEMILEALGRGIHVLCEKPLCIRAEDIEIILEAEQKSGAQLGVCHQNRYNSTNRAVKEYLEGKKVDCAVGQVTWHRDAAYYASGVWRGKKETEGGGVLINQALHTLDLLQWLCGMPETVTANISTLMLKKEIEVEDTAALLCRGNADFTFYATTGSAKDCPVEITLRANGEWIKLMPRYTVIGNRFTAFEEKIKPLGKTCYGNGHEALIADFYHCIRSGKKFWIDGAEGAKVIRLILAAYKSCGNTVKV